MDGDKLVRITPGVEQLGEKRKRWSLQDQSEESSKTQDRPLYK